MTDSIRLAKRIAEMLPCSRREAEQYIEGGWVSVDGVVIEEQGFRVLPQQQIALLPQATLAPIEPVTILFNKQPGYPSAPTTSIDALITPENRASDDRSGKQFLKRHLTGLNLVLPLDTQAGGLLVFTQEWQIARKLTDDSAKVEQECIVEVAGELMPDGLKLLNHGLSMNGKPLPAMKVSWQNETRLRFAFKALQSNQIVRICEMVGLKVVAIKRIRIGRVPMSGLQVGRWRYLLPYEQF
ncbi:rRNA pseudouridine synthase [Sulfurirhabdus autotrophica]|uniref:Dual-specificity RNA pseudouridine synthase RluF n=1 Tax=Sulfurirhabdus autotrophica TaxID=1706046 RepID=A0A4R3YDJ9_9PROT|nr:rRNA pseudouridine synthase [Sulfurirhabdus autotrophica]TCV90116.1 23S rRNA pseudouridine2604 synthase [Sulfurirhabdus autotrophica]